MNDKASLLIVFILGCFASFSQPPGETIFLQTDQAAYLSGTGMNIKAWVFSGGLVKPGIANLYVDLLDERKQVIASSILPVWRGEVSGGLIIPAGIPESVYYLHAYTSATTPRYNKYGYTATVPIFNPGSGTRLIGDTTIRWKASVHVEGGRLLSAQPTKVVVRMHAAVPVAFGWNAEIRNQAGQVVSTLQDKDDNIAIGWLSPASGEEYTAFVKDQRGTEQAVPLPKASDTGAYFHVSRGNASIRYGFFLRGIDPSRGPFIVRGMQQGQVVYTAVLAKDRVEAAGSVPVDSLDRGTLYLELMDANGVRLADRLCYVDIPEPPATQLFDSLYAPLGKRAMQVFQFRGNERILRVFAFARTIDHSAFDEQENLFSQLYLSSLSDEPFIRPSRYFRGDSLLHMLDALYICLSDEYRGRVHQPYSFQGKVQDSLLSFRGLAYDRNGPMVEQDINLVIQSSEQESSFRQVTTDKNGAFRLENLYFMDSAKVFFQSNQAKDRKKNDIALSLIREDGPARQNAYLPASAWITVKDQPASVEHKLAERYVQALNSEQALASKYKTMEEIRVTVRKKSLTQQMDEELSSGLFRSGDSEVIDLVNDHPEAVGFTNIFSFLQGKIPSLQFRMQNGDYIPVYRNGGIAIAIDEVLSPTSLANLIIPANIAMVKLQRYNIFIGGPVLAIYTRRGNMTSNNPDDMSGMNTATIRGYGKEFSRTQVDYRDPEQGTIQQDKRVNLYWNHRLYDWDRGEMETIRFFRNDAGQPYRLTVVGVRNDGIPVLMVDRIF